MTKRRRWLGGLILVAFAASLLAFRFSSHNDQAPIQLLFLGYTNIPAQTQPNGPNGSSRAFQIYHAILLASNGGNETVKFLPLMQAYRRSTNRLRCSAYLLGLPPLLKPGESVVIQSSNIPKEDPWRALAMYTRYNLADQLSEKATTSTNNAIRSLGKRFTSPPKLLYAYSDWIRTLPLRTNRYHITAPPPEMTYDLRAVPD